MALIPIFLKELAEEAVITRKMLAIVPNDRYDWKPHEKSMTIRQLATHIGEIPGWVKFVLNTSEIDFATEEPAKQVADTDELIAFYNKGVEDSTRELEVSDEAKLNETWTMRSGEHIISTDPKAEVIRMCLNQQTHHRAQLGVYLRLLNIPIPGSYGPSADEMGM